MHSNWSIRWPHSSSTSEPYRDTPPIKILFYVVNGELAVVKDACRKAGICFSFGKPVIEMFERPDPAAGNHRDICRFRDRTGYCNIEPVFCAIGFHAGEKNFA